MAVNFLGLVTLGLGLILVVPFTSCQSQCSRIKAAFYLNRQTKMIIGQDLVTIDEDDVMSKDSVTRLAFDHDITAAFTDEYAREFFLFSGPNKQGFTDIGNPSHSNNFMMNTDFSNAFKDEPNFKGIDAIVDISGTAYFFAGCSYITIGMFDGRVSDRADISSLGLPCNVDAALYSANYRKPVVIKGNQVWKFRGSRFISPSDISRVFWGLRGYTFCDA